MGENLLIGVISATYYCGSPALSLEVLLCEYGHMKIRGIEISRSSEGILKVNLPSAVSFSNSDLMSNLRDSIIRWLDKNPELDSLLQRSEHPSLHARSTL